MKGCILPFSKKNDLGLAKNYRGITLTSIAAKIYNALLRNRIEPKIDSIHRKNQNGFRRYRSTTSQILTIRRILEGERAKNLRATIPFVDFTKVKRFWQIHPTKPKHYCIVWNEPPQALASMSMHTKLNTCSFTGNISTLDGSTLKLADKFTYLRSSVSSTETDIDTRLTKAWTAINKLSIIWKSDLTDKMKRSFF